MIDHKHLELFDFLAVYRNKEIIHYIVVVYAEKISQKNNNDRGQVIKYAKIGDDLVYTDLLFYQKGLFYTKIYASIMYTNFEHFKYIGKYNKQLKDLWNL